MVRSPSVLRLDIVYRETKHPLRLPVPWGPRSRVIPFRLLCRAIAWLPPMVRSTGYAGGLDRKEWLLRLEGAYEE